MNPPLVASIHISKFHGQPRLNLSQKKKKCHIIDDKAHNVISLRHYKNNWFLPKVYLSLLHQLNPQTRLKADPKSKELAGDPFSASP